MNYLLDTCIISELTKRHPNENVVSWLSKQNPETLYLSLITIGEIKKGIVKRNGDARGQLLADWLDNVVISSYSDRLIPVDLQIAIEWGRISAIAEQAGVKRPMADSLIAATACAHGLTIVTRNVKDMDYTGVPVLNPFEA